MTVRPSEVAEVHTRLQKATLELEASREYWSRADGVQPVSARRAFEEAWLGPRSLKRTEELLVHLRARYDAFPPALQVLHRWPSIDPDTRRLICHWHLQLSDPLYRAFTGEYLVQRRDSLRPEVTSDTVVSWVTTRSGDRWAVSTRVQFASRLLSSAFSAGLLSSNRGARRIQTQRAGDRALEYLLYLLRQVTFEGSLLANPYLRSVGFEGRVLEDRLRQLPALRFRRQGDLVEFGWVHADLLSWARATFPEVRHVTPRAREVG
ncbi:MAG TPA: hypothetical protein VMN39_01910 [Longimicrobiaceae bacterium]|nr:hypothetical protein [Longimicrobiaceae bacterium]